MADNHENPGSADELEPMLPTERDIPPDFFDDAAPSPVVVTKPSGPPPAPAYVASSSPPRMDEPSGKSMFPWFLSAVGVLTLVAAWFVNMQPKEAPSTTAAPSPAPSPTPEPTPAADAPTPPAMLAGSGEGGAVKLKSLETSLESVTQHVKDLAAKLEGLPKPEPAPDLKPVEAKVSDLAKSVALVTPLTEKVGKIDERLETVDSGMKSLKDELEALRDEIKKSAESTVTGTAIKPAADARTLSIAQGADLFKAGKYKEAVDVFKKLEAGSPKDARVYYYAAMANGLGNGVWTGETETLVRKGIDLEKAGTPSAAEIDAAFSDLPATVKPWINGYRAYAKVK